MKRLIAVVLVAFGSLMLLGVALRVAVMVTVYDWIVGYAVGTLGFDPNLARGLAWFGVALVSLVPLWALLRPSKAVSFLTFAAVGLFAILGWYTTRDNLFTREGRPVRYIAITDSGLVLSERPGVDKKTGAKLKAVTSETAPLVQLWLRTGGLPPLQREPCLPAFNALNGSPLCWYENTSKGILFSRLPGFSTFDGQKLQPVTHALIAKWEREHQLRETVDEIKASKTFGALRVTLVDPPPVTGGDPGSDPPTATAYLPAGMRIQVRIKFNPLQTDSLGMDRVTTTSLAVHRDIGLFPGQALLLRVPANVDAPDGTLEIPAGSTAEGFVAVNANARGRNELVVFVRTVQLFRPRRSHAIPLAGHLDASCATPLMNLELCEMTLDAPFDSEGRAAAGAHSLGVTSGHL